MEGGVQSRMIKGWCLAYPTPIFLVYITLNKVDFSSHNRTFPITITRMEELVFLF